MRSGRTFVVCENISTHNFPAQGKGSRMDNFTKIMKEGWHPEKKGDGSQRLGRVVCTAMMVGARLGCILTVTGNFDWEKE